MLGTSFLKARYVVTLSINSRLHAQRYSRHTYQSLPRIFIQEAHGNIERRTTPALKRIRVSHRPASLLGDVDHVDGSETSSQQALVSVTPCGVHDKTARVSTDSLGEGLGSLFDDDVSPSDFAGHGGVEWWAVGIVAVVELWNDDFGLETGFTLSKHVYEPYVESHLRGCRTYDLTLD